MGVSVGLVALVGSLLGAGGLAALLKVFFDRKDTINKVRKEHIEDLSRWRDEMHDLAVELQSMLEYYRSLAADYEYQLRSHGLTPMSTAVRPNVQTKEGSG